MPFTLFDTSLGTCGLAWTDKGISSLQLPEATPEATKQRLLEKSGLENAKAAVVTAAPPKKHPAWIKKAIALVVDHLDGDPQDFRSLPLDLTASANVTDNDAKIYRALQEVPAGKTVTYGELSKKVSGSANGARAVGRAMGSNPVPILVPCHRVLASGSAKNEMGGFSAYGGVITKERILHLEGWRIPEAPTPLFAAKNDDALPYDRHAALKHLASVDPVLRDHIERVGDFTLSLKKTEGIFAALAESIVYQQLNGKAAATIFARVCALLPKGRLDAKAILAASDDALRGAGLSANKLASLRDLATRTHANELPTLTQLANLDDDAIVEKLTVVRGIGRWTVEMLLIFRLGRADVLPIADYGIKKGYSRLFTKTPKKKPTKKEEPLDRATQQKLEAALIKRAEKWRPYRSVASWYLWRAAD